MTDLSLISLIGIILLIGIVKKNAIMMIDFALEAERERRTAAGEIHLPGVPAALPADHDDDDGGAARRAAAGAWNRAPARNCAGRWASRSSAVCCFRNSSRSTPRRSFISTWIALRPNAAVARSARNSGGARPRNLPLPAQRARERVMNISEPFIRRPVGTSLLAIGLFLAGRRGLSLHAGGGDSARGFSR